MFTGDVDFLVACSEENSIRICRAIDDFGLASFGLQPKDFTEPGVVVQLGHPPQRIDLLTFADGVSFEEASSTRILVDFDGLEAPMVSKDILICNKEASGRPKDLVDLRHLRVKSLPDGKEQS